MRLEKNVAESEVGVIECDGVTVVQSVSPTRYRNECVVRQKCEGKKESNSGESEKSCCNFNCKRASARL